MGDKIMVVEDDFDIRKNLKSLLEYEGYRVELAENGRVALDMLNQAQELPKLIILDLMMPVLDGFQFRELQESISRIADIPVVIMTADGHTDEKRYKVGARAALRKPASIEAILEMVKKNLH